MRQRSDDGPMMSLTTVVASLANWDTNWNVTLDSAAYRNRLAASVHSAGGVTVIEKRKPSPGGT